MTQHERDGPLAGLPYERVQEGRYVVLVEKAERGPGWTDRRTGRAKEMLYLQCLILFGPFAGTRLFMPLNLTFKSGRPRPSSAFFETWAVAMDRKPVRGERMSLKAFEGKVFEGEVRTVTRDGLGRVRPSVTEYSRVSRLLRLLGTRDAYLLPQTEDRKPETEYPTPPFPAGSATGAHPYEKRIDATSGGQAQRRAVGCQKQEKQPGGGPPSQGNEPTPSTPQDRPMRLEGTT